MPRHIGTGIGWGIVATISMSTFHLLAKWLGLFPVWPPTPAAVVKRILGSGMPHPLLIVLAIGFHLAYGGFWGGALWASSTRITVWKGIGLGIFLWLIMHLAVFPFLGWGVFASGLNSKIAPAALFEHLVFGTVLDVLGARSIAPVRIQGTS
jgi:uncharacterized membrane protein YagU involved in acid resistance